MSQPRHAGSTREYDVVVMGSGAAGLSAAVAAHDGGARVLVVEKADLVGGTTGVSGGMPWVPMNHHLADIGIEDDRADALRYIRRLTLGREPDPRLVERYVDTAAGVISYLEERTPVRFSAPPTFNDYYEGVDGGRPAGRSIEPVPFDARGELGAWASRLRTSPHLPRLTLAEGAKFMSGIDPPDLSVLFDRETNDVRVGGPALVAMLVRGLLDRGVELETGTAVTDLCHDERGAVSGVVVASADGTETIAAAGGVVLACGGFEWNPDLVAAFLDTTIHPLSPSGNTGDGLTLAMRAGARLANMTAYWGQPSIVDPSVEFEGNVLHQMGTVRGTPGVIAVNRHGRRFVNEGVSYQDFPKVLRQFDPVTLDRPNDGPVWLIFDQDVRDRAIISPTVLPGGPTPDWIATAPTVADLASTIGLDPATLDATVIRWNADVATGADREFGRGTTRFEAQLTGHFPVAADLLRPVTQPPYYALQLHNGALGTIGGPLIDEHARVRRTGSGVIDGLYAAGNAAAGIFGDAYPGGGASIGPALTFGFHAGRHAAARASG